MILKMIGFNKMENTMTDKEIQKKIEELKKEIENFATTHGSPVGCNMRSLTLQSMHSHLDYLSKKLYQ